ncbi:MAG: CapA family protein [Caulobacteraceae bacterium]|nr:CapA family protein [Caulobacteraceae bacterium]
MSVGLWSAPRAHASPPPYRLLFGGDTSFAESYAPQKAARRGYSHSLEGLRPLLRRSDYAVVNLETPLTRLREPLHAERDYLHWSDPVRAPAALRAAGIDAVGLANNHSMDFGPEGLAQTIDALSRQRLASFGAGRNAAEAASPLLISFPRPDGRKATVAVFGLFAYRRAYAETYGFYAGPDRPGTNLLAPDNFAARVNALRARIPDLFVIAFAHWGRNYEWRTSAQQRTAHALVDAGADLVIGHHGHALQEVEKYQNRWICYGIGNFMFNAPGRYGEHPGVLPLGGALELSFSQASLPAIRLYPLLSDNRVTDYQPHPAPPAAARAALDALRRRGDPRSAGALGLGADEIGAFITLA